MQRFCQKFTRACGVFAVCALLGIYVSPSVAAVRELPAVLRSTDARLNDEAITARTLLGGLSPSATVSASSDERLGAGGQTRYTYRLFGSIPIRTVTVLSGEAVSLRPGGDVIGITIHTKGVLVVGLGSVETRQGAISPGAAAGLISGDVIESVNGTAVSDANQLSKLCGAASGSITLGVLRGDESLTLTATPVTGTDGVPRLGVWVRDSTAGVGTLSFYDQVSKRFAALGHPVSDVDTHSLLTIREGRILPSEIIDIIPGEQGLPGELTGIFSVTGQSIGRIERNTEYGIFGRMDVDYENGWCGEIPLARASEAHVGGATLLSTVSTEGVKPYDCEIVRISEQTEPATKGMVILVTDQDLIAQTGGIVQGMSGSPVLQDGRLVGVVTHVFVNDPLKGYCVYAEWMYGCMQGQVS